MGTAYRILLGRLGVERLAQLGRNPQHEDPESGPRADCLWFEITRHNVCNQEGDLGFKAYWETHGLSVPGLDAYGRSLQLFGLPLTAPRIETNSGGHTVLTQWFERARFEWHPNNPSEFKVLLGLLGKEVRMNGGTPTPTSTPTTIPANSTPNPSTAMPTSPPVATATVAPYPQPTSPPVATATVAPYPQPTSPPVATATSQPTATPPPAASPTPNQMDFVNRVISRTNMYRQQHGCPALTFNQLLTNAAQGHAVDMATHDFVGHTGSDGSSPWDRMERAGYQWSAAAENAAAGYSSPESVVDGWYNEVPPNDGHRLNMLNCGLQDIGVGYYYLANDTGAVNYHHYWVQLFGTPR